MHEGFNSDLFMFFASNGQKVTFVHQNIIQPLKKLLESLYSWHFAPFLLQTIWKMFQNHFLFKSKKDFLW